MDDDAFRSKALPYVEKTIKRKVDTGKVLSMVKSRIEVFPDIPGLIDFLEEVPDYDIELYRHKKMKTTPESSLEVLKEFLPLLEAQEDFSNDALFGLIKDFVAKKDVKNGYVMWPLRVAVSGKKSTPGGASEIMEVLGKDESLRRVKEAIAKLS